RQAGVEDVAGAKWLHLSSLRHFCFRQSKLPRSRSVTSVARTADTSAKYGVVRSTVPGARAERPPPEAGKAGLAVIPRMPHYTEVVVARGALASRLEKS